MDDLAIVSLMPMDEPGDFSISMSSGPLEFLIESFLLEGMGKEEIN